MYTDEKSFEIVKPRRSRFLWLKRIGKGLLLAAIALAVRQAWHHHQVTKKLEETLAELDRSDPGWRLQEIEAARESIPEEENSARVVVAVGQLLPRGWPPPDIGSLFAPIPPERQLDEGTFARLKQELNDTKTAVEEARKLAVMPHGRYRLAYKPLVYETLLSEQQHVRRVAYLLTCDARRHAQLQDPKAALISCRASLNAARSLGDEPIVLSQLIRDSCVINTCFDLHRVLVQGEPPPDDLASIQQLLQEEDAFPDMRHGSKSALFG